MSFVSAALAIGLGAVRMSQVKRGFYSSTGLELVAQATVEEVHTDDLEITDHPIERGAAITDHAFKRPAEVVVRCVFSNSPSEPGGLVGKAVGFAAAQGGSGLRTAIGAVTTAQSLLGGKGAKQVAEIYGQFLEAQAQRALFDVYTGKRAYKNMLLRTASMTTSKTTENALDLTLTWRQVLLVATRTVDVPVNPDAQKMPEVTASLLDQGVRQLKQSARKIVGVFE